jgi:hypothetical protein
VRDNTTEGGQDILWWFFSFRSGSIASACLHDLQCICMEKFVAKYLKLDITHQGWKTRLPRKVEFVLSYHDGKSKQPFDFLHWHLDCIFMRFPPMQGREILFANPNPNLQSIDRLEPNIHTKEALSIASRYHVLHSSLSLQINEEPLDLLSSDFPPSNDQASTPHHKTHDRENRNAFNYMAITLPLQMTSPPQIRILEATVERQGNEAYQPEKGY